MPGPIDTLVANIGTYIITPLIVLLIGIATVVFLWGLLEFILGSASPEKRQKGLKHIGWGIVGLFIMISAWGIFFFIKSSIGVE